MNYSRMDLKNDGHKYMRFIKNQWYYYTYTRTVVLLYIIDIDEKRISYNLYHFNNGKLQSLDPIEKNNSISTFKKTSYYKYMVDLSHARAYTLVFDMLFGE